MLNVPAALLFSCLSFSFMLGGGADLCSHSQYTHTFISLSSAQIQHRNQSALLHLKKSEHEPWARMDAFFSGGTEWVQDIYFDIYTQRSPITIRRSGREGGKGGSSSAGKSEEWSGDGIRKRNKPTFSVARKTRVKVCGILVWATPLPLERKRHPSSPLRAPV